jgi:indole-3-glycerol phosphate synthase
MGVLDDILRNKRSELPRLRQLPLPPAPELRAVTLARAPGQGLRFIAEIKRRSPSAGPLSTRLGIAERGRAYERGGAHMISVLCDEKHFDGAYQHLSEARAATSLPILCKEFVIDESQLDLARAYGADAVLLIARCLEPARLRELAEAARQRGLEVLAEVHAPAEVPVVLDAGARLVGVNARNLDTLIMNAAQAQRILAELPDGVTRVHLSGLSTEAHVRDVAASRADAALMGECLMRQDDPTELLARLVAAGAAPLGPASLQKPSLPK